MQKKNCFRILQNNLQKLGLILYVKKKKQQKFPRKSKLPDPEAPKQCTIVFTVGVNAKKF